MMEELVGLADCTGCRCPDYASSCPLEINSDDYREGTAKMGAGFGGGMMSCDKVYSECVNGFKKLSIGAMRTAYGKEICDKLHCKTLRSERGATCKGCKCPCEMPSCDNYEHAGGDASGIKKGFAKFSGFLGDINDFSNALCFNNCGGIHKTIGAGITLLNQFLDNSVGQLFHAGSVNLKNAMDNYKKRKWGTGNDFVDGVGHTTFTAATRHRRADTDVQKAKEDRI